MSWQKSLTRGFSFARDLLSFLELPLDEYAQIAEQQFPTRVPLSFARRMQKRNRQDPLLLQVLASHEELQHVPGYVADPLDEMTANPLKGLIHKYHGRVLLTLTGCAL